MPPDWVWRAPSHHTGHTLARVTSRTQPWSLWWPANKVRLGQLIYYREASGHQVSRENLSKKMTRDAWGELTTNNWRTSKEERDKNNVNDFSQMLLATKILRQFAVYTCIPNYVLYNPTWKQHILSSFDTKKTCISQNTWINLSFDNPC